MNGPKDTVVYLGIEQCRPVYVGVTRQTLDARLRGHRRKGKNFSHLQQITPRLTRLQALAVETLIQVANPHFVKNRDPGIWPSQSIFEPAINWAAAWAQRAGLPIKY